MRSLTNSKQPEEALSILTVPLIPLPHREILRLVGGTSKRQLHYKWLHPGSFFNPSSLKLSSFTQRDPAIEFSGIYSREMDTHFHTKPIQKISHNLYTNSRGFLLYSCILFFFIKHYFSAFNVYNKIARKVHRFPTYSQLPYALPPPLSASFKGMVHFFFNKSTLTYINPPKPTVYINVHP